MKNVLELHPKDIVKILDKRVIGQTHAKQVLAVSIRNQVRRYKLPKELRAKVRLSHILLKGPTGSGKTELMRAIYAEFGIPTHFIDCTEFSEVGYHGKNVSDILPGFLALRHSVPAWYGKTVEEPKTKPEPQAAKDAHKAGELYNHQTNILWPLVMGWWAAGLYNRLLKDVDTTGLKFNVSNLRQLLNCRLTAKLRKELYKVFDNDHVDNPGVVRLWHLYTWLNQNPKCRVLQRELVSEGQRYMSVIRNGSYRWNQIQIGKYHKELPEDLPKWPKTSLKTFLRHDNSPATKDDLDRALDIEISLAIALSGTVDWGNDRLNTWPGKTMVEKPWNLSGSIEDAFNDITGVRSVKGKRGKAKRTFLLDFGFIFFDEIDKLGARGDKDSVSRDGVQRGLLTMLSNQSVVVDGDEIDISGVGFVGAGAFAKMSETDLMPELLGRFPMRVDLQPLKYDDYLTILKSDFGAITSFQTLMRADDVEVVVEDGAYRAMADLCDKLNAKMYLGARRLSGIVDELLVTLSMDVDETTRKLTVTRKLVESMVFEELKDKEPLDENLATPET